MAILGPKSLRLARQEVIQQPQYHEQLELGMSVQEMVEDHLEDRWDKPFSSVWA